MGTTKIYFVTAFLTMACSEGLRPSKQLFQRAPHSGEAPAATGHDLDPTTHADTVVQISNPAEGAKVSPSQEAPSSETGIPTEPMDDSDTISEPVSIGGAFLTCAHDSLQAQNKSTDWMLTCKMSDVDFKSSKVSASFMKIDAFGKGLPLKVISQSLNPLGMTWVLSDGPDTMFINKLEASIGINGNTPLNFGTEVEKPISLTLNRNYWLANEPNNNLGEEDCVEFVNQAERVKHTEFYNLPQPPLGRLNDQNCSKSQRFLCRRIDSSLPTKWMISPSSESYDEYALACPAGYKFSLPMNDAEVAEVAALVDVENQPYMLWVAMTDIMLEGTFSIILK